MYKNELKVIKILLFIILINVILDGYLQNHYLVDIKKSLSHIETLLEKK